MIRLDKLLADAGYGTRSEVKKLLKTGNVSVNDEICRKPEQKVNPGTDTITVSGEKVLYQEFSYYLFYKPSDCVTAKSDALHKTVMDYFPEQVRRNCSPVGRLDKDTEGLLLITDDGTLNHHLMSPAHHVKKTYYATLDKKVPEYAVAQFAEGIDIGDEKPTLPAELVILENESDAPIAATLTLSEGRFHQVKRMFEAVGCKVVYLKRLSLGTLTLGDLKSGEYRSLTPEEVGALYQ